MSNEEFINAVNIASLVIDIMNYQENLTQTDKAEILQNSQDISDLIIDKIDSHLQNQDKKIDLILQKIEEISKEKL